MPQLPFIIEKVPARTVRSRRRNPAFVLAVALMLAALVLSACGAPDTASTLGAQTTAAASGTTAPTTVEIDAALSSPAEGTQPRGSTTSASATSTSPPASTAASSVRITTPSPTLIWSEEFDGAANALPEATRWVFETGGYGWGNRELECYTKVPGNASTDGTGNLVITAIKQPGHRCVDGTTNDYTSARITTQKSFTSAYGRLEIRAKVPTGSGTWPAFWALGDTMPTVGWPATGEIDVMEIVGNKPTTVLGSVHGPTATGSHFYITRSTDVGFNLGADFHVYAADWTTDSLTFSVDGKAYGTITRADVEQSGVWVFDHPYYLLVNLAVGGNFPGPPDATATWPQKYVVDYVRVYQ